MKSNLQTPIPTKTIGPIKVIGDYCQETLKVPLATFEDPLWLSVARGARSTKLAGGIKTTLINESMTRSILLQAPDAKTARKILESLPTREAELSNLVTTTSRYAKLKTYHGEIVGNLIYLRFSFTTGNAAGHNMATKAAEKLQEWLLGQYPTLLRYLSISGNYCADKKNSAINGILGRGKAVIAEAVLPREICLKHLRTTPEQLIELNIKKNLLGSIIAGGVRTANAHFANMLLALYLATGQDAANIIEGSQGFTHTELQNDQLYFSVTLPNLILGTTTSQQKPEVVRQNLADLGCLPETPDSARRLAEITAATVLCGELSLLAAQTNQGELMRCHLAIERR